MPSSPARLTNRSRPRRMRVLPDALPARPPMNRSRTPRPASLGRHCRRNRPPAGRPGNDRQRKLHQPGRDAGRRQRADEQVRRRLSRQALLRRLRVRRSSPKTSPAIARKQLFGAEHVNVQPHSGAQANTAVYFAAPGAGRRRAGAGSGPRRAPHPRHEAERLRQAVPFLQLRRAAGHAADRLRPDRRAGARAQAEDDRRRGQRLSAGDRPTRSSPRSPRECGAKLFVDMAHYAGLVAAGPARRSRARGRLTSPPPPTRRCAARAAA